jgi:integrase
MSFADLTEAYLRSRTGVLRESTLAATRCYLRSQLLPAFGGTPIDRLTAPAIADWFHRYSRSKPGGANEALGKLRAILDYAREQGFLDPQHPDPTAPLRRNPRPPRGRLLSSAQLKRLGEVLTDPPTGTSDAARAIRLILLTGCRPFEIARLTWSDTHKDRLSLGQTKTGPREVLLSEDAGRFIARLRKTKRGSELFPGLGSGPRARFRLLWEKIRAAAGLPEDIRLHDLRHSYASHAIMKGETLYATGKLLGHSDPDSTKCYAHLEDRHLAKAAEKISARIAEMLAQ